MATQSELIVQQLVREFGRPAPADPARRYLLDTLAQRGLLRTGSDVLTLLAPAELVAELAARGAHVTAAEPLEALVEQARQRIGTGSAAIHWVRRDPHRLPFRRAFDLVLAPGLVLGATGQEHDDEEFLRIAATTLRPGGTLVLDLPNRELLARDFVERLWGELNGLLVLVHERWDLPSGILRVEWQLVWPNGTRDRHERALRLYTASEVTRLCRQLGYVATECWGDDDGTPYNLWSPRLLVIARTESGPAEPLVVGETRSERT
ncbi:class I SAM-dependent methyltransferase [Thermomicrobium sp. 4228-Ro]|uniref:class I SAM-dependent methyltransferase n=1 Tax=Thermomicrobium sp. 4228-Ro TaxID=2993937 RepID=UPI0022499A2A|nr:class I SAM-dependent methyltransferase [Thermomicrobium sp. 4228-Ro]MCX2728322.1 class I SAM-dependent methyltransferase [Thermomicrobium sp. 4228-Ro]